MFRNLISRISWEYKVLIIIVALALFLPWFVPMAMQVNAYDGVATSTPIYVDRTPDSVKRAQDKLLDEVSLGCETKGSKEPDGAIILDVNNEMSIGRFMFQIKTVQYYVKRFEGRDISRREAITLAVDPVAAKELARKIIFEADGIKGNWYNCSIRFQLEKEVQVIKEFMK